MDSQTSGRILRLVGMGEAETKVVLSVGNLSLGFMPITAQSSL